MDYTKIAILTCWYGAYPRYFTYFIHSCSYNPTIDFYIITDNLQSIDCKPENVIIIHKTVNEIIKAATIKLGFTASIDNPYKLNDFKPAYGFVFPEIVEKYDFWGHSDLDIIYGNIREFLNDEMLSRYDFISLRHDYTTGCFCLYRNNKKINTLFMRSKDYKLVLSSPQHFCFDECNFAWAELRNGKSILELETPIESFTHVVKRAALKNEIEAHFDFILIEGRTGRVVFDRGKITYKKKFEAILYHLVELKKIYAPEKVAKKIPAKYYISPTRIYHNRNANTE